MQGDVVIAACARIYGVWQAVEGKLSVSVVYPAVFAFVL